MTRNTVAIVAHDAGGAEIISSYVRQRNLNCVYSITGPAQQIFEHKLGICRSVSLEEAINLCDWLLCGTSWKSDLHMRGIKLARINGKKSVSFVDHWNDYSERFVRNGARNLPDEIWVGDRIAETLAKQTFPSLRVKLVPNPYFLELAGQMKGIPALSTRSEDNVTVLYVCEPVRDYAKLLFDDENAMGYYEEDALRFFLSNVHKVTNSTIQRIVVRPHPSERENKYSWAAREFDLPIVTGNKKSLLEEVKDCDIVVGCESMAMVVGLLAKKRVVSCIPPGGRACSLPHLEIEHLQRFLSQS